MIPIGGSRPTGALGRARASECPDRCEVGADVREECEELLKQVEEELGRERIQEPLLEWLRERNKEARSGNDLLGTEVWAIKSPIDKMSGGGGERTRRWLNSLLRTEPRLSEFNGRSALFSGPGIVRGTP
jgi:hypothetical protein